MKSWDVNVKMCWSVVLVAILLPLESWSASRRIIELRSGPVNGPPNRPDQFKSVAELNKYLADLAEYYKMMSRPRFGKRSEPMQALTDGLTDDSYYIDESAPYQANLDDLWRALSKVRRGGV